MMQHVGGYSYLGYLFRFVYNLHAICCSKSEVAFNSLH